MTATKREGIDGFTKILFVNLLAIGLFFAGCLFLLKAQLLSKPEWDCWSAALVVLGFMVTLRFRVSKNFDREKVIDDVPKER